MSHDHTHGSNKRVLLISFIIITIFMIVEVIGGILTGSLALLADAGHMLSDSISLLIALIAFTIGERAANHQKTYGYKRFEILAALLNGTALLIISLYIFYEAFQRLSDPPEVASTGMLIIATIGLIVNIIVAYIMMQGDTKENLNMRAAFLHVLSDLLGSVGAVTAALLMIFFNWMWADILASVLVATLILISGWRVTKASVHILMEGKPENVNLENIINIVKNLHGVKDIHDLHVWSVTSGQNMMTCHVVVDGDTTIEESEVLIAKIEQKLIGQNIGHVTVQVESGTHCHKDTILCQTEFAPQHHSHMH